MPPSSTTSTKDTGSAKGSGASTDRASRGVLPIPWMKAGWYYRPDDLTILYSPSKDESLRRVGTAPRVTGVVSHLTDDGLSIRVEYQVLAPRQRRKRIITEDELDRGTWAAKLGVPRPTGPDARQAYASVIREQALTAPEVPARSYYNEAGDLVVPDKDAQAFGYMTCAGTEEHARDVWNEIGAAAANDPNAALVMGAFFSGPILDYLQVPAHILNVYGGGQMGKSTVQTTAAGTMGDIKPRQQKLMMPWNSSKQGITQGLRARGYMPVALEEHSSSGRTAKQSGPELSQIVAGANRETATADGSPRESDGFFHSVVLSSSNKPLRWQGQTEDLASRLLEIPVPFYANCWMDADGNYADRADKGAEHLSKRLKRLTKSAGGWPLVWANRLGMFKAANLAVLKKRHLELCAKHSPRSGGIPDTIAEIYMAWVVGAEMLGKALGDDVEDALPDMAERAAVQLLHGAIQDASEVNIPDGERLWYGLDAIRIEAYAYPPIEDVVKAATGGLHKVRGFVDGDHWYVTRDVVQDVAAREGLDDIGEALSQLEKLGVHLREKSAAPSRSAAKRIPKHLRGEKITGISTWMHCFDTRRAEEIWAPEEDPTEAGDQSANARGPAGTTPGTTVLVPENEALTSAGTTGTTGTTISENVPPTGKRERLELIEIMDPLEPVSDAVAAVTLPPQRKPSDDETAPAGVPAASPQRHSATITSIYPTPAERVTDPAWSRLALTAAAVGVLSVDGLHLPNRVPVPMALPASVDDVVPMMTAYGLQTLYLHQSVIEALGLPTFEERRAAKVATGHGSDHEWATPAPDSRIIAMFPEGLSEWTTLTVTSDTGRTVRLEVAIPAYEGRFDKLSEPARGGFGGAPTGAALLDAVMIWTLSTMRTNERTGKTRSFRYYRNPNKTAEDLAGGKGEKRSAEVLCQAIRAKQVPPATYDQRTFPWMTPRVWQRPGGMTPEERGRGWLHQYDKTAAWMSAYSNVGLGIGEPVHAADGMPYSPKYAGFWRVPEVPGRGLDGLPEFKFGDAPEGGHWLRTPAVDLLRQIYPDWTPEVLEAWYWPDTRRALNGMYDNLKRSRDYILSAIEDDRPGGKWAKQVNGKLYQSFWGYLQRVAGPKQDYETGGNLDRDIYWRPDWSGALVELAAANTYRALMGFAQSEHYAMTLNVDAITIASDEPNPLLAKPALMTIGNQGGNWSLEGSAPMSALLPLIDQGKDPHKALSIYLKQGD